MPDNARGRASSLHVALAVAVATAFAGGSALAPIAYDSGTNPLAVNAARASVAALVLAMVVWGRGLGLVLPPRERYTALALGVVNAGYAYALYAAIVYVPVAVGVLIFYSYPFWTALVAWLTRSEAPTGSGVLSLVLGLGGVALVIGAPETMPDWRGVALALAAAFGFTFLLSINARMLRRRDSRPITLHILASASCTYFLAAVLLQDFPLPQTGTGWAAFWAISILYTFAFIGLFVAVSALGPVRAALVMNFEPLASVILAWLILGQSLTHGQLLGAGLVIGAITLAAWRKAP